MSGPPKSESERETTNNPYAPPDLNNPTGTAQDQVFQTKVPWTVWLASGCLLSACVLLAIFQPVAGLLGVLLVIFGAARVPQMLRRGPQRLMIHNALYLFGSSLVVVTLVVIAAGISYFAMATTVTFLEPNRPNSLFPALLGGFAFIGAYLYLYRVSVFLPF